MCSRRCAISYNGSRVNLQLITSSYPRNPADAGDFGGIFVRSFALELAARGHKVIVQPIAPASSALIPDPGIVIEPITWEGEDRALVAINPFKPRNWLALVKLFTSGAKTIARMSAKHRIDRVMCFWVVPGGLLARRASATSGTPYDVWALGSDIAKMRSIPLFGPAIVRHAAAGAGRLYADGMALRDEFAKICGREVTFLPTCRAMPDPQQGVPELQPAGKKHLIFVGRYEHIKGPDLLIEAIGLLRDDIRERLHLHMFGLGSLKESLRRRISELQLEGTITLGDAINAQDLSNCLSRCDFLVVPSRSESIPVIFSDAAQLGTPVIATPVGDFPRLIPQYQCGVLSNGADAASISKAIETAIVGEDRSRFALNMRQVADVFSIRAATRTWLDAIENERVSKRT